MTDARFTFDVDGVTDVTIKATGETGYYSASHELTVSYKGKQQVIKVKYTQTESETEDELR